MSQSPKRPQPANPAVSELRAIKQELSAIRRDLKTVQSESTNESSPERSSVGAIILKIVLGFVAVIVFFTLLQAGDDMATLKSRAGNTVAEAFYQAMGGFVNGLSFFFSATLIYFAYSVPPVGFFPSKRKKKGTTNKS
jgi:hypothetical protein